MAKRQPLTNPKSHPLWEPFKDWCLENNVGDLEHEDDWFDWWKCFLAGAQAYSAMDNEVQSSRPI